MSLSALPVRHGVVRTLLAAKNCPFVRFGDTRASKLATIGIKRTTTDALTPFCDETLSNFNVSLLTFERVVLEP